MTEPQAVEEFLTHLEKERDVSPNTLIAYRRDLEEFVEFLGRYYGAEEWSWQGLDRLAIHALFAHLTRKKLNRDQSLGTSPCTGFYESPPQRTGRGKPGAGRHDAQTGRYHPGT
jgi:site-specific recombinase XerC